jgi:hypothetical protein
MSRAEGVLVSSCHVHSTTPVPCEKVFEGRVLDAVLFRRCGGRVMGRLAVLDFAARQCSENSLDQFARGLGA